MVKFDWIWVPEGILCILGVSIMAIPILGPMSEPTKFIIMMVSFCIFMLGQFLEDIVQKIKTFKNNRRDEDE